MPRSHHVLGSFSVQELAMLEYELLHFRPSQLASAATLLAQLYMNDTPRSGLAALLVCHEVPGSA